MILTEGVRGYGPKPSRWMIIGQSPGAEEIKEGRPFVGRSGAEQAAYMRRHELDPSHWYMTNVVKEFVKPKGTPTQDQVSRWAADLSRELDEVSPSLIIAVGAFAARALLGPCDMDSCHGLPHRIGAFDPSLAHDPSMFGAWGTTVVPCYHPAAGMYDPEIRALCDYDYGQAAHCVRLIEQRERIDYRDDPYAGIEAYSDVDGPTLATIIDSLPSSRSIGYDTEGLADSPWSLQIATQPGEAFVLRYSRPDFVVGAAAVQRAADRGVQVVAHNLMHDMAVSRSMGIELRHANLLDTMYQAFALKLEPQGLKALAWRWNGRRRESYGEIVGDAGTEKQVAYLSRVLAKRWDKAQPRVLTGNDGSMRIYKPQGIARRALSILSDHADVLDGMPGTVEPIDLVARWKAIDRELRAPVEAVLGSMPTATLDDVPLERAINYAAADADDVIRLAPKLTAALAAHGANPVAQGMKCLPIFETIQAEGMPVSRSRLLELDAELDSRMTALQSTISRDYWNGEPFNPASQKHVAAMLKARGLKPAKMTKGGSVSTAKGSIEHLRLVDPAIGAIIDWRELLKMKSFTAVVERLDPNGDDIQDVCAQVKITRIPTRRIAMSNPNLLQIPTRHELGKKVRSCYVAPEGHVLSSFDLSMIEVRVAAHLSNDPVLCDVLRRNGDVHTETASRIFGIRPEDVDPMKHRHPAKRCTFGCLYGVGGDGLYTQLRIMGCGDGWNVSSCDHLIKEWFKVYRGVRQAIDVSIKRARATGYVVEPLSGARRYLPGLWSQDRAVRSEAERQTFNHEVQGMAQTMLQNSMIYLGTEIDALNALGFNVRWRHQQHDELIFTHPEDDWPIVSAAVINAMENHTGVELCVPVKAEGRYAKSWGDLKG